MKVGINTARGVGQLAMGDLRGIGTIAAAPIKGALSVGKTAGRTVGQTMAVQTKAVRTVAVAEVKNAGSFLASNARTTLGVVRTTAGMAASDARNFAKVATAPLMMGRSVAAPAIGRR